MKILSVSCLVVLSGFLLLSNRVPVFVQMQIMDYTGSGVSKTPVQEKNWEWPRSTPEEQNLDGSALENLVRSAVQEILNTK